MCGTTGALVSSETVKYQILQQPEGIHWPTEIFSLCMDPGCEMAYYSADFGYLYLQRDIRTELDHKENVKHKYVCYCHQLTYDEVINQVRKYQITSLKAFLKLQNPVITEKCKQKNPFGCSCLADISKLIETSKV